MKQESLKFSGRASNPATRKFSPAQIAAQKLFAERARAGTLGKGKRKANPDKSKPRAYVKRATKPKYSEAAVNKSIASSRSKISAGEGKTIKRLLMGRTGNPIRDAGEFVMTVNGKSKTRFFVTDDNQWASSYGFDYRLLSDVTKYGSPVKFTKTRAIVAIDEGADGKPITDTWNIRGLKFYKTNPDKDKPNVYLKRPSQVTGAPPGKRLLKRRTKALFAPAGYFPNPKAAMITGYQVICMHPKKHVVGIFKTMAEAKLVATAMANAKGVAYGVKTVKVHKSHFAV